MSTGDPIEITKPPRTKTVTARQLAANRANSRKCTGPRTPEGKAHARFNAVTHGLTAEQVCLPGESRDEFDQRRREYIEIFQPSNLLEFDILDDLVTARWRKARGTRYEKCLVLEEFMQRRVNIAEQYDSITLDVETALAYRALADKSSVLDNLHHYETRILRNIDSDMNQLQELRRNRPPAGGPEGRIEPHTSAYIQDEESPVENETIPISGHPDAVCASVPDQRPAGPAALTIAAHSLVVPRKSAPVSPEPQPCTRTAESGLTTGS